ncbi:phage tail protein [Thioalkalivibrio versutus]|uniref:Phage tail protein n=1 Tax=Thioalkalivibrio versutus TaxID=106634 RepID=A0A0G3G5C3_9GAMM|nr:phage tail protein [Thioalkalivibrio versutus]
MLARCPQCGVTHALARGAKLRQRRVHCSNCDAEFDLFPALEIGGAGERVLGQGLLPARQAPLHAIERAPGAAIPLNIERHASPLGSADATRRRSWPGIVLAAALMLLLGAQLLAIPPVAPDQSPQLAQARAQVCAALPCPTWHPRRAPGQIRTSAPDFFTTSDGTLHLQFVLESPIRQAWPILDIRLTDQLGTPHGTLRLTPDDYTDTHAPMNAHSPHSVRLAVASPHGHITGIEIQPR